MPSPKIGAISFIQQFGNTLNFHPPIHLIVADGIFSAKNDVLYFHKATLNPDDISDIQDGIQNRVLRYFSRKKYIDKETIEKMLTYPLE